LPTPYGVTFQAASRRAPPQSARTGRHPLPSGHPLSLNSGVQRLKNAQVPIELVPRRTVSNRPPGANRERTRTDAIDDAIRVAEEVDQVLDQNGIAEMNRCHLPQRAPELPQRGSLSHCRRIPLEVKSAFRPR
jgi:hypothetical protein